MECVLFAAYATVSVKDSVQGKFLYLVLEFLVLVSVVFEFINVKYHLYILLSHLDVFGNGIKTAAELPVRNKIVKTYKHFIFSTATDSGVSFKYSAAAHKDALSKIDLHIKSGMTVGILGGTGSGKSTLVQLIPRLYDVSEGTVRVGGRDVREYDTEALRESVAMVLQKNLLFSGTIKENLLWGNPDATDEEIAEACRLAQADEFIRSFPEGYETKIEQGGTNVSGGQKQRLCIARALLKRPKILILDDSTSAVDTHTDALIRRGFREYIPDTTKLIIAQRVASVMDADLICVMENGRIVASGKHEELLDGCDIYREIYEQQTANAAPEKEVG